jgi:hypothetical protein
MRASSPDRNESLSEFMQLLGVSSSAYRVGKTRVFFKEPLVVIRASFALLNRAVA